MISFFLFIIFDYLKIFPYGIGRIPIQPESVIPGIKYLYAIGFSYIFWLIALNGVPILLISIFSKNGFRKKNTFSIKSGIAAGLFATLSYSIVVWSMQYIEIAYVSSIREVSVIFATIIGMVYLYENNAIKRIMPSVLIVTGITLVYFQIL